MHGGGYTERKRYSLVFKTRRKVLRCSDDLQLYQNETHTTGTLTLKAFIDNASDVVATESSDLSMERDDR